LGEGGLAEQDLGAVQNQAKALRNALKQATSERAVARKELTG
jgi:hypothetical protein